LKGKSMDTKFEKSSVIPQPNAFKSQRPSVLGKPTTFSNYFIRKDFSKSKSVTQSNVSNDFSKPVTAQTLPPNKKSILKNTNVLAPGMYKLHTDHNQTRTSQLPQDSRKTNKCVSFSSGVISTTSVSRPQLKSNLMGDRVIRNNSQGKKQKVEDQRRNVKLPKNKTSITACNNSLNAKTLNVKSISAMCDKCVLIDKHAMSKDETPEVLIDFLRLVQIELQAQVRVVRTDKGTKFLNQTLPAYFAAEGILHQTSVARTPEQNGFVERQNHTLHAYSTARFTQNRSLVITRPEKTPYHIINNRKLSVKFFHIFGSLCYISRAYKVFNERTRVIMESIHVNSDELPQMASDHISSDPAPECQRMTLKHDSLSPAIQHQANIPQADRTVTTSNELDLLFSMMFDELLNGSSKLVSKSSAVVPKSSDVSAADATNEHQQLPTPLNNHTTPSPTSQILSIAPTVSHPTKAEL
nr:hypothetical protein [Tanacetum cinerariifolium]